jgi:hypothetical protein
VGENSFRVVLVYGRDPRRRARIRELLMELKDRTFFSNNVRRTVVHETKETTFVKIDLQIPALTIPPDGDITW